jgi:chitinase
MRLSVNFGYYQSWAVYRNAELNCNPVLPEDIDVAGFGYTHLAFAFAGISWRGELEPYNGSTEMVAQYLSFNRLKGANPGLKTLIAVGGW